ncbi:MAG TPA: hypothetical protein VMX35_15015, partial [Acidobacteriota bacterium]|nr:hypothetical protein [Acidobacteriota bacterium]
GVPKLDYQDIIVIYGDEEIRGRIGEILENNSRPVNFTAIGDAESALAGVDKPSLVLLAVSRITDSSRRTALELISKAMAFDAHFCIACDEIPVDIELELFGKGAKGIIAGAGELERLPALLEALGRGEMWCSRAVLQNILKHLGKARS